ncbi:unnamed protein product [Peronospora belbahrii]|uniref:Spp2/MOS2 G-patch domain-containing protein n=1 Tax=Peronospora belbahrii TaxID=622444 RepID=A0ABN8CL45_9STRA|nr:unnamed protein product [Peronospora belbahrii]
MKLGGFALKKSKKKALGASTGFSSFVSAASQDSKKVFVTDFDPNALVEDQVKPLVIPLLETNTWKAESSDGKIGTLTVELGALSADQEATTQLLAESKAPVDGNDMQQELVIPVISKREKRRAELFEDSEKRPKKEQQKPILQQNVVPGLDELQDVTEKYRHDVAQRPDAPDVHSDVYKSVPVEAFGAALLRGMGWKGDVDLEDVGDAPKPRHKLLGLGATKRPGEDKKTRKKRRKTETLDDKRRPGLKREDEKHLLDRERRRSRSVSRSRSDRRKRSRSRSYSHSRDDQGSSRRRGRDRDRHRRSRSHSRGSRSDRRH